MKATLTSGLLAAVLLVPACSEPPDVGPLVVARAYLAALSADDLAAARRRAWLPPDSRRASEAVSRMRATGELLRDGRLGLEALEVREAVPWALVVLRVRQPAPGGEVFALRAEWLLRDRGRWRVVAPSRLADPELSERGPDERRALAEWFHEEQEALTERWLRSGG